MRSVGVQGTTAQAKRDALDTLERERRRYPVVTLEAIARGTEGRVAREGYLWLPGYLIDPADRWLAPPPENATRYLEYDTPIGAETGKLGRYYQKPQASPTDPLAGYFAGDPRFPYSTPEPTGMEILALGRYGAEPSVAITVTGDLTRTSRNGSVISARWTRFRLDTGYDESLDQLVIVRPSSTASGSAIYADQSYYIDLAEDYAGVTPPKYGPPGDRVVVMSDNQRFRGVLVRQRWLVIEPTFDALAAIADGAMLSDMFTLAAQSGDLGLVTCHPWHYVDPADDTLSAFTFAAWPEVIPPIGAPVPTVGIDGVTVTPSLAIDAAFDPLVGRVPTAGDEGLGLQMMFVHLHGKPGTEESGGCC